MNTKLTFVELVDMVAQSASTSKRMSELFLKELVATVSQALIEGEQVTAKGIGTFAVERKRDDGTPRVTYTPDKALAQAINQPFEQFETIMLNDDITDEMLDRVDDRIEEHEVEPSAVTPPPFVTHKAEPAEPEPTIQEEQPGTENKDIDESEAEESHSTPAADESVIEPTVIPLVEVQPQAGQSTSLPAPVVSVTTTLPDEVHRADVRRSFIHGAVVGALAAFLVSTIIALAVLLSGQRITLSPANHTDEQPQTVAAVTDTVKEATPAPVAAPPAPVVTDTVSNTMFLSRMAVKHYGKADFWVYIYEENKSLIDDPNAVPPGTVVVIPPAQKYGIDPNDKASIDLARRKSFEVLSKY